MKLRELFTGLFARAVGKPPAIAKPSSRKPQHGHTSRRARRLLGTPPQMEAGPSKLYGDVRTTGRQESASQRKYRRALVQRCAAQGHRVLYAHTAERGSVPVGCRCGAVDR